MEAAHQVEVGQQAEVAELVGDSEVAGTSSANM